jgi:dihydrolipoamide dehydrogenase
MGKVEGFVKIIAHKNGKILGAHILSHCASEMLPEVTMALKHGIKVSDLASVIHAHPTLSESIRESALNIQKRAIHILNKS